MISIPPLTAAAAHVLAAVAPDAPIEALYGPGGSEVYDAMTRADHGEVRELLGVARRTEGAILELACGSGRLTLPLARLGREVVGLDSSARMRELLTERARAIGLSGVRAVGGDMSDFAVERTFGLIVLATTSVTLLDAAQRASMLACVRRHLAPGGVLLISVQDADHGSNDRNAMVVPTGGADAGVALLSESVDHGSGFRDVSVVWLGRDRRGAATARAYASRVHLVDPPQLARELRHAGFTVRSTIPVRQPGIARRLSMMECVV